MDLENIFETGKPDLKKLVMINHYLVVFINKFQVSYEGFIVETSLKLNSPCIHKLICLYSYYMENVMVKTHSD